MASIAGKYFIMHEDIAVAEFSVSELETITDIRTNRTATSHLPVGYESKLGIKEWQDTRGIPVTRDGFSQELRHENCRSPFAYMIKNKGLSLSDHYWVRKVNSHETWAEVNLYENDFESSFNLDFGVGRNRVKGCLPNATTKGDMRKRWVIDKETHARWVLKGSSKPRQAIAEVVAAICNSQFKVNSAVYRFETAIYNGKNRPCVASLNFTDTELEFIPAIDICRGVKKRNDASWFETYITICAGHSLNLRPVLEYQIMIDFILSNLDRHLNNFGVLRNAKTLQWISYAPLFDSDNALFSSASYIPVEKGLLNLETNSFRKREVDMLKYCHSRNLIDINLLPPPSTVMGLLRLDDTSSTETNLRVLRAYSQKVKYFEAFQNGANLWNYR